MSNRERYKELEGDNIEKVKKAVNNELKSLCDGNKITTDMKKQLKQITPTTPIARPTLKAHKNPLKVRLIINTKGSSYYKIAKFVSRELKPLTTSATSFIKDSEQFVNKLKNIQLQEGEKIVSFDIVDMYPSLPKQDVIKEVERRILSDSFQTKCNKETLVRLAKISLEFMSFRIGNKYYEQAEGLFIGSPASPCFAELFIQRVEEVSVYTMLHAPRIWIRKVDDTFTINNHETNDTLTELNQIHPQIKFTAEEEENGQIPFLDCLVSRTDNNRVKTKVYKKPTHTGQYTNFYSNQPLHEKLSTVKSLARRAKLVCTGSTDLKEELEYIEKTMQLNEFPKVIVKKAIHETLSKSKVSKKKNEDDEYAIKMYMPYEKGISENIARIGKKFNVKLVHTKGKSLKNMFMRNITTSLEKHKQSGVVYRVTCGDCGSQYVGETGRSLETRMVEHRKDAEGEVEKISGLSEHLRQTMHKANFDEVEILNKESNFIKRKFKEAIAIKKNNAPLLNKKEEIKALSNVWENII